MPSHPPAGSVHTHARLCPRCGGCRLARVPRRFVDHLQNLFVSIRRYRCSHIGCDWEGNLRVKRRRDGGVNA